MFPLFPFLPTYNSKPKNKLSRRRRSDRGTARLRSVQNERRWSVQRGTTGNGPYTMSRTTRVTRRLWISWCSSSTQARPLMSWEQDVGGGQAKQQVECSIKILSSEGYFFHSFFLFFQSSFSTSLFILFVGKLFLVYFTFFFCLSFWNYIYIFYL